MSTASVYQKGGDYIFVLHYPPSGGEERHEVRTIDVTGAATEWGVTGYASQFVTDRARVDALLHTAYEDAAAREYTMIHPPDDGAGVVSPAGPGYTREQVSKAVNAGADLVRDSLNVGDRDIDLINLVVNATLTLLDDPGLSLDDVISRCYETDPAEVRGWWSDWS